MAVNQTVVRAMTEVYSRAELVLARETALSDILSGVQITAVNFEGGGATGRSISAEPAYVLEHVQAALDQLDDSDLASRPTSSTIQLSNRQFGT